MSGTLPSQLFLLLLQVPCTVTGVTGFQLGNLGVWQPHPSHRECVSASQQTPCLPGTASAHDTHLWGLLILSTWKKTLNKCPAPLRNADLGHQPLASLPAQVASSQPGSNCTQFANKTLKLPETPKSVFPWDFALHLGCLPLNLSPAFWTQTHSDRTWLCSLAQQPIHLHTDFT